MKNKLYTCKCDTGGEIILGKALVKWLNVIIIILLSGFVFVDILKVWPALLLLSLVVLCVYIPIYFQIYKEMKRAKHNDVCSKKAAFVSLPYQMQGSWFEIKRPKKK